MPLPLSPLLSLSPQFHCPLPLPGLPLPPPLNLQDSGQRVLTCPCPPLRRCLADPQVDVIAAAARLPFPRVPPRPICGTPDRPVGPTVPAASLFLGGDSPPSTCRPLPGHRLPHGGLCVLEAPFRAWCLFGWWGGGIWFSPFLQSQRNAASPPRDPRGGTLPHIGPDELDCNWGL